jgi:acetyl-CoA C-acetyltransferase
VGPDDVAHADIYSCFPSAVQIAATELGLGTDRQLTVTGGLPFAGGPLNNYVTHGIAAMADVLRGDPGSIGLNSANGGYVTKHALGIYSTEPPPLPFRHRDVQDQVDQFPSRAVVADYRGPATVESYTVMHGHEGPEVALIAARLPDGSRTWARSTDGATMASLMREEGVGQPAEIGEDATAAL